MDDEQKLLFRLALSEDEDAPYLTDDPVVNHAVDQHTEDSLLSYDERAYKEEIEAWKRSGGLILSLRKHPPNVHPAILELREKQGG